MSESLSSGGKWSGAQLSNDPTTALVLMMMMMISCYNSVNLFQPQEPEVDFKILNRQMSH